jgi:hypothetical protein
MKKDNLNNYKCKLNYPSDYINTCLQRRYNIYLHLYKHVEVTVILTFMSSWPSCLDSVVFSYSNIGIHVV